MAEIRTQLVSDVNPDSFADMCAQTLVYGMLSSRVTNPRGLRLIADLLCCAGSQPVPGGPVRAGPRRGRVPRSCLAATCPQLVADLRATNVDAHPRPRSAPLLRVVTPSIHFYEEFLKKYDSQMRADAGAFYTPQPAVEFIVRAVDEVLRSRFGLSNGHRRHCVVAGGG